MFCPKCRYEYKPDVTACPDCGAALVAELEPFPIKVKTSDKPTQLVTVFETYVLPEIVIAKSILEEAGIHFISRDQIAEAAYFQNGPASIMVAYDDAVRAHDLLANLAMDHIMDEQMEKMTFDDESDHSDDN
jgi:hypothetical protein